MIDSNNTACYTIYKAFFNPSFYQCLMKNKPQQMTLNNRSYFFDQGLFFECRRCGACCKGDPGVVLVYKKEIKRIARFLSVQKSNLIERYLDPFRDNYRIKEYNDGRCYFYQDGCSIYPVRPSQCQTFPFWFDNLRSPKKWRQISRECPGIGQGRFFNKEQILEIVHSTFVDYVESIDD